MKLWTYSEISFCLMANPQTNAASTCWPFFWSLYFFGWAQVCMPLCAWRHMRTSFVSAHFVIVVHRCLRLHRINRVIYLIFAVNWVGTMDLIAAGLCTKTTVMIFFSFYSTTTPAPLLSQSCPLSLNCHAMFDNCLWEEKFNFLWQKNLITEIVCNVSFLHQS